MTKKHDARDPEVIEAERKAERKAEEIKRNAELRDLSKILSTGEGKRFFNRLFAKCRVYHTSFTGNSATFFNEGKRSVALEIFEDIAELANNRELTPETLVSLMLNQVKED